MSKPVITNFHVCSAPVASDARTCPACGTSWPIDGKNRLRRINDLIIQKLSLSNSENPIITFLNIVVPYGVVLLLAVGATCLVGLITVGFGIQFNLLPKLFYPSSDSIFDQLVALFLGGLLGWLIYLGAFVLLVKSVALISKITVWVNK